MIGHSKSTSIPHPRRPSAAQHFWLTIRTGRPAKLTGRGILDARVLEHTSAPWVDKQVMGWYIKFYINVVVLINCELEVRIPFCYWRRQLKRILWVAQPLSLMSANCLIHGVIGKMHCYIRCDWLFHSQELWVRRGSLSFTILIHNLLPEALSAYMYRLLLLKRSFAFVIPPAFFF